MMENFKMPADPEAAGWMAEILAGLGLTGAGGTLTRLFQKQNQRIQVQAEKSVEFEQRHLASEARLARHSEAIKQLGDSTARTETTLIGIEKTNKEIKDGIKALVNHAAGSDVVG